ncbi:transcriptional regulator [Corynebacterium suranareeae]|uniref:Transcriptional regulator n=1 Tax=Corynebacterium suranareeae TaxID=2506452 RepID=A0A161JNM6_9CORY|nr:helix-turn-helix transcriptional regulator [Corynebacterium suranareeae]BAU95618.1 transcriptional regulator [Corynebacterium suranareeae]
MNAEEIGMALLKARKDLGLRQAELADLAGVSERFIRDVEKGKATVQLNKVIDVLSVLGLEMTIEIHDPLKAKP